MLEESPLALVERCCDQGNYKQAIEEFENSLRSVCNAEITEQLKPLVPSNTETIPVDTRFFWRSQKLPNQELCTVSVKPLTELMEEISMDLQETKQAQDSVLYFFGSDVEEEGRCIRAFVYVSTVICGGIKRRLMRLYEKGHEETVTRLKNAWKYNFYLMKLIVTCYLNAIHMKRVEDQENKIKGMQELQRTMYKHRLVFLNHLFAAEIVKNSAQPCGTDCFFCKQTATTDSKINIYTGKRIPDTEKVVARDFVFCGKCVPFVTAIIFLRRYLPVLKFHMCKYSRDQRREVSIQEYFERQHVTQVDSIRRSISDVIATLSPGAVDVDDSTVLAIAIKLGIGIFTPDDPVFNMNMIVPLDIEFKGDMVASE